jgi:hypothetical protein
LKTGMITEIEIEVKSTFWFYGDRSSVLRKLHNARNNNTPVRG